MQTITGLFDSYGNARAAVRALNEAGITDANLSVVSNAPADREPDEVGDGATAGAEIGAGLGAAGGLLAGLGIVAVPGFGAVVAGGWLFATAIGALTGAGLGAATGGLVGALTRAGVPEVDAHIMADTVGRGGAVVSARVDDVQAAAAAGIMRGAGGIELAEHRGQGESATTDVGIGLPGDPRVEDPPGGRVPLVPPFV